MPDQTNHAATSAASNVNGSDHGRIRISLDLVTASRRHLSFLRSGSATVFHPRSIQRYEEVWLPLISGLVIGSSSPPSLLPPPDVHWVWLCHCFDPPRYRDYCVSRFGFLIDRPAIFDDENEDYALSRCREIWELRYPSEPFDLEISTASEEPLDGGDVLARIRRHASLAANFSDPFMAETVYLVAAKRRYLDFLRLVKSLPANGFRLVPTSDVLLMWLTHQSFPGSYERDLKELGEFEERAMGFGVETSEEERESTRRAWEEAFDEPYELAGMVFDPRRSPAREFFNWATWDADLNRKYKSLHPRFLLEVCVFLKGKWESKEGKDVNKMFMRLKTVRCHREMKLEKPIAKLQFKNWQRIWQLYCEFGTRGIVIEVRNQRSNCIGNSKMLKQVVFWWNDLLRVTSLTLTRELNVQMRAMASITPPVQAPYFLKCVPDRVTDDSGAMISDVILRMKEYHPQEGRWLSRTVLDHAGRECFVVRSRVGRGFWRRGGETPTAVKWEDRIIEVREGPWSYVASSVGSAPDNVVGTAAPKKEDLQDKKTIWCLSSGDVLTIEWGDGLNFLLENENSSESASLHIGRKLQYQMKEQRSIDETNEEEHYVTLIRFSPENPEGKATALINWKLFAMEFLPEEDAVIVLLLCVAIVRTMSEVKQEDAGGLLARRRVREVKTGLRDWGSIMLSSPSSSYSSPHVKPWYWNASEVLASAETYAGIQHQTHRNSPSDGKDELYKQSVIP
ncbi:uncharacterized protein LOC120249688 [Dioscorea cayenensis subsp. rotundata]|uniref:Uncharacterized protein LOC120249688 n=1 Tax=Dioscorea cayennensis subsp. rotundata TaxID=55577 RepID=A0AB40AH97_DIOCR|nr:uncharacterized protein LOC120249688 [Dioscorea cayenensis subsp. rotundata]